MKNSRWFVLLSLVFTLILVACGGSSTPTPAPAPAATDQPATEGEQPTEQPAADIDGSIWVLLPDSASSARWETDDRRFFEAAFSAAGVEYSIVNAEGDARTQQTQAEQAITAGAKVILLVNLDSGSGAAIIALAREAGVAIIDYDRLTVEGPGADIYVSFDNVQVGRTMGDVLEPLINAQSAPKVALLNGSPTDNNATLFREGYLSTAQPHFDDGSWSLVDDQWVPGWDNQQALVVFEQMLTAAGDDITAVFAANDGLANAVISAYKSVGISPAQAGIPISGQDATVGGIQNILAGDQAMTVYKPIKAEAEAAAEAALALLNGTDLTTLTGGLTLNNGTNDIPFVALTPVGVTKDNIAQTVIADGFRTWEEICVGDFAQYCPGADATEPEEEEVVAAGDCNEDLTGETITIHQQAGREGPLAAILGQAFVFATADGLAAINADGGVCGATLAVVFNETNYATDQEVAVYEQTRGDALIILTYGSGATIALADRLNEDKIVSLAAGVSGEAMYSVPNGYTLGPVPIYSDQFAGFLQWLSENWADVKPESAGDDIVVGVVGWANAFGTGATTPEALAVAESLGITVLPLEEQTVSPDADVSGAILNLLASGANVIYNQNLSFSVAQVIGTVRTIGVWDDVIVGGVGWSFNQDVLGFLGANVALANGYYGVVPHLTWSDTDAPGVQEVSAAFAAGGYPETERTNTYLLTYGSLFALRDILEHAINENGYANLSGETILAAAEAMDSIDARGLFSFDFTDGYRAPRTAQIRQWQLQPDGTIADVQIEDFFLLPDTRPGQ